MGGTLGERLAEGTFPAVDYRGEELIPNVSTTEKAGMLFYPCQGIGYHDFAVGKEHAVCNKCQYVLVLTVDTVHSVHG